jgi:hypothetical protein
MTLISNFNNNNFNPPQINPLNFSPESCDSFESGLAIFGIENDFLFEPTFVGLNDIAYGASDILSQCCSSGSTCGGGTFTITGEGGIAVILTVSQVGFFSC